MTRRTRRASRTALSRALERIVSLHVSTLGRAGGVSARMVVSHLDVCSELVALAVRCGAGPDADRPVPGRGARGTRPHGRAARDWRFADSTRSGNVFRRARPLGVN